MRDGDLDMRMDRNISRTAADLVNTLPAEDLARVIMRLGEERWARRIARAIVQHREQGPLTRTRELADLITKVVPKTRDSRRIHPATRTFQALRMAVNRELDALVSFLDHALDLLKPGGRLCTVAFHSIEDRIIKQAFREWAKKCRCPADEMRCVCEGKPLARLLMKKPLRPGPDEVQENARARSARMRAIEKVPSELD
jgi:16S rRNA (cytosine1402-N4)-methyltransferase